MPKPKAVEDVYVLVHYNPDQVAGVYVLSFSLAVTPDGQEWVLVARSQPLTPSGAMRYIYDSSRTDQVRQLRLDQSPVPSDVFHLVQKEVNGRDRRTSMFSRTFITTDRMRVFIPK